MNRKTRSLHPQQFTFVFAVILAGAATTLAVTLQRNSPSISNITPATTTQGTISLTINGTNFDPATARIVMTGPNCQRGECIVVNSALTTKTSTQLVAPLTLNTVGNFRIQVQNGPTGTLSNRESLTVNAPSISNLSPATVPSGTFSLAINGTNFNPANAQIVATGPSCTPCVFANNALTTRTTTQLAASLTLNTRGNFTIQVQNGADGTLSNRPTLTVNPISIGSVSPTRAPNGTFSLTVNGTNFNPATVQLVVNGRDCNPCVVSNNLLTTKTGTQLIGPITINTVAPFFARVQNGPEGTLTSSASFTVNRATVTDISPTSVARGTFSLTVNEVDFNPTSAQLSVFGPSCNLGNCIVPNNVLTTKTGTQLVGPLTLTTAGKFFIQVQNDTSGPLSNLGILMVDPPVINSISPVTVPAGTFPLTINGSNFNPFTGAHTNHRTRLSCRPMRGGDE